MLGVRLEQGNQRGASASSPKSRTCHPTAGGPADRNGSIELLQAGAWQFCTFISVLIVASSGLLYKAEVA